MSPERIERLQGIVKRFRKAIDDSSEEISFLVSFRAFPRGACGDASDMLGRFLNEIGEGPFEYVSGWRERQSHAWLEGHDLTVDITADQFADVYQSAIVTADKSWHTHFVVEHSRTPGFDGCVDDHRADLESAYRFILGKFNDQTH